MASRSRGFDPSTVKPLSEYTGRNRYVDWIEDYLGVVMTEIQKEIIYTIMDNQRTVVVSGNGIGKTYTLACFSLAYLFLNYPTSVLATSGTYQKLRRTYCRPVQNLHENANVPLPGEYLKSSPPRIVIPGDPEVYWEAASSAGAGELEGVHNKYTLAIIEEADKGSVTEKTFDSLGSLLTDKNDKIVAVANPPTDETDIVYQKMQDDNWAVIQPSSFDSHNVQLEMNYPEPYVRDEDGEIVYNDVTGDPELKENVRKMMIPEMVSLSQIRSDWEAWNEIPWPGAEEAMKSGERQDLDVRWYRRRMGLIPPVQSESLRPFTPEEVEAAYDREPQHTPSVPDGMGWDVARGANASADYNALSAVFGDNLEILDYWRVGDHVRNEQKVKELMDWETWTATLLIDSVGVGSEAADRVKQWYPYTERYNSQAKAANQSGYANCWTEGLVALGDWMREGGSISHPRLREELLAASRAIEMEEQYHAGTDTTRFVADPKWHIKELLGRSPDLLDAAIMAVRVAEVGTNQPRTVPGRF